MHKYRTHTCVELTKKDSGKNVKLSGWIHRKRDHGNLLFFDLRDHYGLTQCVTENSSNFFKEIEKVKPESVVCVSGKVVKRSTETINKDLFTVSVALLTTCPTTQTTDSGFIFSTILKKLLLFSITHCVKPK